MFYQKKLNKFSQIPATWIYVPDRDGNFYWQDLNDMGVQPLFDSDNDVVFTLFTRKNPEVGQTIIYRSLTSIEESNYDKTKPLRVICHGWFNNLDSEFSTLVRKAYLKAGDFNVIVIDWSKGGNHVYYPIAA